MAELPLVREELGFRRTECGCAFCQAYCLHVPGSLGPTDLQRLCPPGSDVFAWAEEHLRALIDKPYPALVPVRRDGPCHWHFGGRCAVHDRAPFGCAFFDAHMDRAEVERRSAAVVRAVTDDAAANGLHYRVWLHLRNKGLTAPSGDRAGLRAEMERIRRGAARRLRRVRRKEPGS
jgi:hypothetical protein